MTETARCVVIGGGLAGLASAVWLAESGHQVTLLERRGTLGGRTHGMYVDAVADQADNGQHVFESHYENLFRYLESVGTREHVRFPSELGLREAGGRYSAMSFLRLKGLSFALGGLPGVHGLDRLRATQATARWALQCLRQPADLDEITADQWLRRLGMPASARRASWDMMITGLTGDLPELTSAKVFADLFRTGMMLTAKHRRTFAIGYPTVDLDTLFIRGAERVFAERGVDVRHRAVAKAVEIRNGQVTGVTLADGERIPADAVISAVPVWSLGGLLEQMPGHERLQEAARVLTPVPIVSVNLYLDRPIGMRAWGETLIDAGGVVDQVWDRQVMHDRDPSASWFYSTTVSAGYEINRLGHDELVEAQLEVLRRYYPEAAEAKLIHAHVVRMPKATFAQPPGSHGLRPDQATSVRGLALAGDWTRTDWSTTMEGAAQSAARAVDVVLPALRARREELVGR